MDSYFWDLALPQLYLLIKPESDFRAENGRHLLKSRSYFAPKFVSLRFEFPVKQAVDLLYRKFLSGSFETRHEGQSSYRSPRDLNNKRSGRDIARDLGVSWRL